jgi:hypothetical protein
MKVKLAYGDTYECDVAYKGYNYARLVQTDGTVIAHFEGIVDFSIFSFYYDDNTPMEPYWTDVIHDCKHKCIIAGPGSTLIKGELYYEDLNYTKRYTVYVSAQESDWYKIYIGEDGIEYLYQACWYVDDIPFDSIISVLNLDDFDTEIQLFFNDYVLNSDLPFFMARLEQPDGTKRTAIVCATKHLPDEDFEVDIEITREIFSSGNLYQAPIPAEA